MSVVEKLNEDSEEANPHRVIDDWIEKVNQRVEATLIEMGEDRREQLDAEYRDIMHQLRLLIWKNPHGYLVQKQIAQHFRMFQTFWGSAVEPNIQALAYRLLGEAYISGEGQIAIYGQCDPCFTKFMGSAIVHFMSKKCHRLPVLHRHPAAYVVPAYRR